MITAMEPPQERTGSSEKKSATCFFHTKKWFPTDYLPYILLKDVGENRPFSKDVCLAPAVVQEATASCCHPTATSG